MKIEEIMSEWAKDAEIDPTRIGESALEVGRLHHKYYQMFIHEKLLYYKLSADLKQLRVEKQEFYNQGPSQETKDKGWTYPNIGKVLKSDIPAYMEGDKEIIELTLKINYQNEKIEFLSSIIKLIVNRNFNLRIALDDQKFKSGA